MVTNNTDKINFIAKDLKKYCYKCHAARRHFEQTNSTRLVLGNNRTSILNENLKNGLKLSKEQLNLKKYFLNQRQIQSE